VTLEAVSALVSAGQYLSHQPAPNNDLMVFLMDKKGTGVSRIVICDDNCEDQGLPAPGILTTGVVVGSDEHGNLLTGRWF